MTLKRTKSQSGSNHSALQKKQRRTSLNQVHEEIDNLRGQTIEAPVWRNLRKAGRAKLLPNHLKTVGEEQLLYWLKHDLLGSS